MRTISELTGWTWGAWVNKPRTRMEIVVPIPKDLLEEVIIVSKVGILFRSKKLGVHIEKLISIWTDHLEEWQEERLREEAYYGGGQLLYLYEGPEDCVLPVLPDRSIAVAPDDLDSVKSGFNLWIGAHETRLFPQFQAIARKYGSVVQGHDGGSEMMYDEWLAFHFMPEEAMKFIHQRYEDPEKRKLAISCLRTYPPIVESKQLTKNEHEAITRLRADIASSIKFKEKWKRKEQKRESRRRSGRRK
jgi:hypothetical protein